MPTERNRLRTLAFSEPEEYVTEMVELCDYEAKTFSRITGDLRKLIRKVNLRRGKSLSNRCD
jgi:hypothetical protein